MSWIILSALTGNPIVAAVILLVGGWILERYTLGVLPGPARIIRRFFKAGKLRRQLSHNPHDRKARFDLAELLLGRRQYRAALDLLTSNIEAGDHDAETLFLMGIACYGTSHVEKGELFFDEAEKEDPTFRLGAVDLERGRWRLTAGNAQGAREALERLLKRRQGTVEGRVLLSRALAKLSDPSAKQMNDAAWHEYTTAPRFVRRAERLWAWRAKPSRPFLYAVLIVCALIFFQVYVRPRLPNPAGHTSDAVAARAVLEPATDNSNVPSGWFGWQLGDMSFATPERFKLTRGTLSDGDAQISLVRTLMPSMRCDRYFDTLNQSAQRAGLRVVPMTIAAVDAVAVESDERGVHNTTYTFCGGGSLYVMSLAGTPPSELPELLKSIQLND
ncbi:MAG: tetratricopeptide repeat protein [Myxococcaceae bacterium]